MSENNTKRLIRWMIVACLCLFVGLAVSGSDKAQAASKTKYLIKVNKQMNCVTVYEKDEKGKYTEPVKAFICSTGYATKLGTYNTMERYRWRLMVDDVWAQYATRIYGGVLFHSVWYYHPDPSTLSARQYNKLGTTCSHGCIRLTVEDAKWIYDNCGIGTKVVIYNDEDPGPLGKPEAMKLPLSTGWDPTDTTNKNNPWNKKKPKITGAKNITVEYGAKLNLKKGVKAKSTTGEDITDDIKISGKVDTTEPGKYKITYKVTDLLGRTAKKKITVTVKDDEYIPTLSGVKKIRYITDSRDITREVVLEGITAKMSGQVVSNDEVWVDIVEESFGMGYSIHEVTYTLTGQTGKSKVKTCRFVQDYMAPTISGVAVWEQYMGQSMFQSYLNEEEELDREWAMTNITVYDNLTELTVDDVKVEWAYDQYNANRVCITYTAEDEAGNVTAAKSYINLYEDVVQQ